MQVVFLPPGIFIVHPAIQQYLPKQLLSKVAGLLANSRSKFIKNSLIKIFTACYPVKMTDAVVEDPYAYPTFNHFFTRALKPNLRPIASGANAFVSPADGTIFQHGSISKHRFLHAKGHAFTTQELLGPTIDATEFKDGSFVNIYLAPVDYHRVHMPVSGTLQQMAYVPGKLFSVNNRTVGYMPYLFARNERVVTIFATEFGKVAVILVGAMVVGSISTAWAGIINPGHGGAPVSVCYPSIAGPAIQLQAGQELGLFQLGSTVIVLMARQNVVWQQGIAAMQQVRFGQILAAMG